MDPQILLRNPFFMLELHFKSTRRPPCRCTFRRKAGAMGYRLTSGESLQFLRRHVRNTTALNICLCDQKDFCAALTAYLGAPSGVWVKSKQSDMLSAEPSRWLIDGTPKFSSQNFTMLTKECRVFEI